MDARAILSRLRHAHPLDDAQIGWFARGLADGAVSEAQAGAFAMAICRNGLTLDARVALTCAMRDSGEVMSWDLPGPVVDKHSTGGVGDTVSLILAPVLAACGAFVPMVSGRGLGHTGGTLDKLESIPGVCVDVAMPEMRRIVARTGVAIVSAGPALAPADRTLYAVRDVTGTVDSIDLLTASILAKKLAEGCEALVLDVKTGSGAFLTDPGQARELARSLVAVANGAGCQTRALLSDMDQPLAPSMGNALEVIVALEVLTGVAAHSRLTDLTLALSGELLELSGLEPSADTGTQRARAALESGHAAERFGEMVAALGGPADLLESWRSRLGSGAPVTMAVPAPRDGFVSRIDGQALGLAVVALGGGRKRGGDTIDPRVGLSRIASLGARLAAGDAMAVVHAASQAAAQAACRAVSDAIVLSADGAGRPERAHPILERIVA